MNNEVLPDHIQTVIQAQGDVALLVINGLLKPDVDYGIIPGTNGKRSLYKPGAEKLNQIFKLYPVFIPLATVENWDMTPPLFHYRYECRLFHRSTGEIWGTGIGSCNSREKKYRWRSARLVCPECGQETLFKSKDGGGFYCWSKKGGCGAKFNGSDGRILSQESGQVENPDIADLVNTLDKMAQKRALIAATLIACAVSEFFTQDIEDLPSSYILPGSVSPDVMPDVMPDIVPDYNVNSPIPAPPIPTAPPALPHSQKHRARYSPHGLLSRISALIAYKSDASEQSAERLNAEDVQDTLLLMKRILPVDDSRRALLYAMFGVTSTKDLNYAQAAAIRAWIGTGPKVSIAKAEADDFLASLGPDGKLDPTLSVSHTNGDTQ